MSTLGYPLPPWGALFIAAAVVTITWFRGARLFPLSRAQRALVFMIVEVVAVLLVAIGHVLQAAYGPVLLGPGIDPIEVLLRAAANVGHIVTRNGLLASYLFFGILPGCIAGSLTFLSDRLFWKIVASGTGCALSLLAIDGTLFLRSSRPAPGEFLLSVGSDVIGGAILGVVVGLTCHAIVRRAEQLERPVRRVATTLLGSEQRRIASALTAFLAVLVLSSAYLFSRPAKMVSYSYVEPRIPLVMLDGDGSEISFGFASRVTDFRTVAIGVPVDAPVQLAIHGARKLLVLRRTFALEDSLAIDTALTAGFAPPLMVSLTAFEKRQVARVLAEIGIAVAEYGLGQVDTVTLSLSMESSPILLSAGRPFDFDGQGTARSLSASGGQLVLEAAVDTISFTVSRGTRASGPLTVFLTLPQGASLEDPPLEFEPRQPTTLVLEDCWYVDVGTIGPWSGRLYVRVDTRRGRVNEQAEARAQRDTTIPPVTHLSVSRIRNATFESVESASIVVGAERDTIDFMHVFHMSGEHQRLAFTARDGLRYEGMAARVLVNGDHRVRRRVENLPPEVPAALAATALAGLGWLLVKLLRLRGRN